MGAGRSSSGRASAGERQLCVARCRRGVAVARGMDRASRARMRGGEPRRAHRRAFGERDDRAHRAKLRDERRRADRPALPFPDARAASRRPWRWRHADALARPIGHAGAGRHRRACALRFRRRRRARGRRGAAVARRAELPDRPARPAADAGSDDAADPRVDWSSARARPDSRRRAQLRRIELRQAGDGRPLSIWLAAAERHVRSGADGRSRILRIRRRRHAGAQAVPDPQRRARTAARRGAVAAARGPAGRGQLACVELEPRTDRPDGEPERRTRRPVARCADRGHRARDPDAHQHVLVDRRPPQQIPVRLRIRATDRERPAHAGRQAPELPRHLRPVLAQPARGRRCQHVRHLRHAVLREGRACANHPCRHAAPACVFAGVDVFGGA